jgi:hypothetical protein
MTLYQASLSRDELVHCRGHDPILSSARVSSCFQPVIRVHLETGHYGCSFETLFSIVKQSLLFGADTQILGLGALACLHDIEFARSKLTMPSSTLIPQKPALVIPPPGSPAMSFTANSLVGDSGLSFVSTTFVSGSGDQAGRMLGSLTARAGNSIEALLGQHFM